MDNANQQRRELVLDVQQQHVRSHLLEQADRPVQGGEQLRDRPKGETESGQANQAIQPPVRKQSLCADAVL